MNDAPSDAPLHNTQLKAPSQMTQEELRSLTDAIIAALKTVYDPEIPADIYELGLIYNVDIDDSRFVTIEMTLTAPACPVAGEMPNWVENARGLRSSCRTSATSAVVGRVPSGRSSSARRGKRANPSSLRT